MEVKRRHGIMNSKRIKAKEMLNLRKQVSFIHLINLFDEVTEKLLGKDPRKPYSWELFGLTKEELRAVTPPKLEVSDPMYKLKRMQERGNNVIESEYRTKLFKIITRFFRNPHIADLCIVGFTFPEFLFFSGVKGENMLWSEAVRTIKLYTEILNKDKKGNQTDRVWGGDTIQKIKSKSTLYTLYNSKNSAIFN